jgi:alkaline phosphatase D
MEATMDRRLFLQLTLAAAGSVITGCHHETETPPRQLEDGTKFFPQSICSGDPRPTSVILWARVADADVPEGDLALELEAALDDQFTHIVEIDGKASLALEAEATFDHCVKVRLTDLSADTVYYYRFVYAKGGKYYVSRTGRTKTAPAADADAALKFAFVCCQDYNGRYYNTLARMLKEPLDFFVHLGDYVYETNGDPTFQSLTGRRVEFSDQAGAIALTAGDGTTYFAAKSLSNYRDLYRTYRSDPMLQAVHEKFPMIATWDDHEFADDCHGATATYFNGKQDETDVNRKKAADHAWFEYMPVDYMGAADFRYDAARPYPDDIRIWRDFEFGKHLHLVMTDLRTYRADHLIPEDAFPGAVVLDEPTLKAKLADLPDVARPYVDIDDPKWAAYKTVLQQACTAQGADPAKVKGNLSVLYINAVVSQISGGPPVIDGTAQAAMSRGVSYVDAGKLGFFTAIGSREFTVKDAFDLLAKLAYDKDKASQEVMGADQESWFLQTMQSSTKTWKVWGNEYCLMPIQIDLTKQALPDQFKQRFYMTNDGWDGFRDKRSELIDKLSSVPNVVAITGDIHAFYAATPMTNDGKKRLVEFVGSSLSASTFKSELKSEVAADPVLSKLPGAALLAAAIDTLLEAPINPHLGFADSGSNGFVLVDLSAAEIVATYHAIPEKEVATNHYADAPEQLDALFTKTTFKTVAGGRDLYMKQGDGTFLRWNPQTLKYE